MAKKALTQEQMEEFNARWEEFELAYPRRQSKAACDFAGGRRMAMRLVEREGLGVMKKLVAAARAYKEESDRLKNTGTPYVKMASGWINGDQWRNYAVPDEAAKEKRPAVGVRDALDVIGREIVQDCLQ